MLLWSSAQTWWWSRWKGTITQAIGDRNKEKRSRPKRIPGEHPWCRCTSKSELFPLQHTVSYRCEIISAITMILACRGGATIGGGGSCTPHIFQMVLFLLYWPSHLPMHWPPHLQIRGDALACMIPKSNWRRSNNTSWSTEWNAADTSRRPSRAGWYIDISCWIWPIRIRSQRVAYFGHVARKQSLEHTDMLGMGGGGRGPRSRWIDGIDRRRGHRHECWMNVY